MKRTTPPPVKGSTTYRTGRTRRLVFLTEVEREPGYEWARTRWLRRQVGERHLAFHKVAGRVLIDLADLDAYADRGRIEAGRSLFAHRGLLGGGA